MCVYVCVLVYEVFTEQLVLLTCFRVKSGCSLFEEACPDPVPHADPGLFGTEIPPSSDANSLLF